MRITRELVLALVGTRDDSGDPAVYSDLDKHGEPKSWQQTRYCRVPIENALDSACCEFVPGLLFAGLIKRTDMSRVCEYLLTDAGREIVESGNFDVELALLAEDSG